MFKKWFYALVNTGEKHWDGEKELKLMIAACHRRERMHTG